MKVVWKTAACVTVSLACATAVAAFGTIRPTISAAPGDQPGYRRVVELELTRTYSADLTAALTSGDTELAARAALALGRTKDLRAVRPLSNASGAPDVALRVMVVYGYGLLAGKPGVSSGLVLRALSDPAGAVRVAACDAAGRLEAAGAHGAASLDGRLEAMLGAERDPIVRARAATTLAAWTKAADARGVAARLAAAYGVESNPTVRWHEAWALRRAFATQTPEATVVRGLRDPDETARIQFADLVARRDRSADAKLLEPLLSDPSWRVREQAFESMIVLGGGTRTAHLAALPAAVVTPSPSPQNTESPLPRSGATGAPHKPAASDLIFAPPLHPTTSALMDGPMPGPHPRVRIGTTKGTIVVRLYPEWAPSTVANFLGLVDRGWYDGLRWFRIVPDFVVQTGDKTNTGEGDAGYTIPAEESPLEQRAGVISMGLNYTEGANPGPIRDSAGTQFYITLSPQLHLDRDFTVFGEVESGFDTLGRLVESDTMTRVERLPDR